MLSSTSSMQGTAFYVTNIMSIMFRFARGGVAFECGILRNLLHDRLWDRWNGHSVSRPLAYF